MPVTIRVAQIDDVEALADLAARTFPLAAPDDAAPDGVAAFIATVLSAERFREYVVDPGRLVLVADDADGGLVGYAMLIHGEPADPDVLAAVTTRPTVDLNKFYVHADHHGSGIARALMAGTIDAARAAGMRSVWLGVNQENGRAIRFYTKQGFEQAGTKRFLLGDRYEHDYVLERRLT